MPSRAPPHQEGVGRGVLGPLPSDGGEATSLHAHFAAVSLDGTTSCQGDRRERKNRVYADGVLLRYNVKLLLPLCVCSFKYQR